MEQIWIGKQSHDLVRSNGEVAVKASGNEFMCHVCMIYRIDTDGLITRIDEYYTKNYDDGMGESEYKVLGRRISEG